MQGFSFKAPRFDKRCNYQEIRRLNLLNNYIFSFDIKVSIGSPLSLS